MRLRPALPVYTLETEYRTLEAERQEPGLSGETQLEQQETGREGVLIVSLLTVFAIAVHGYHPYAEDGGVYVAGIRKLLDPSLYPFLTTFVTEHLRFSLFAPLVALLVRSLRLRLETVLFALYCGSIGMTLFAGWMLASRVTPSRTARGGAVTLLACWLTLPIAGTSLMLMDPYVTARSFSTPLVLMALAWALDACACSRRLSLPKVAWACALVLAALLHPLMAGYGLAAILLLRCAESRDPLVARYGPVSLFLAALVFAASIQAKAPTESADYVRVALTRDYWFPLSWHWYEQFGAIAPLALLWLLGRGGSDASRALARCGVLLGSIGLIIAMIFSHESLSRHMVARLQPMRVFQLVYELMILLLGAWLGEGVLRASAWRWGALLTVLGASMFWVQRCTFPASGQVEWPGLQPRNAWSQAFWWAREHTPKDAVFAMNPHYILEGPGEDAQGFRAIAERSSLPDYSKDGGESAITPELVPAWTAGQQAQAGIEGESDSERVRKLRPAGVTWIVLEQQSTTGFDCPYQNQAVKVCRLPDS